jgi:ABC-2 type transport system permease protein
MRGASEARERLPHVDAHRRSREDFSEGRPTYSPPNQPSRSSASCTSSATCTRLATSSFISTWVTTFALVPRRERVIAVKLLAGVAVALAFVGVCLLTSLGATALVPVLSDGEARWDVTASGVAAAVPFLVMWMLAGAALGLLVMSSAPAIALSFVIPTSIVGIAAAVPAADHVLRWIDLGTTSGELNDAHPAISGQDWAHLAAGVALWVLVPLGIGFIRLRRRDVTSS